jgi:hypothetical protein
MWIAKAVTWLFEVGEGTEAEAGRSGVGREETCPDTGVETHLYGQAEAIRVLYQTANHKDRPPKPPRPKRARGLWIGRCVDSLRSSLSEPVGTEA